MGIPMNHSHTTNELLSPERLAVRAHYTMDETTIVQQLINLIRLDKNQRDHIATVGADIVDKVRRDTSPSMMESFLAEYGLSTSEGVGLMCLAEALLRVPDAETIDELIYDKIEPSDWGAHLGQSSSPLINASTWALLITGKVLDDDESRPVAALRGLIRRVGEPVVRTAVAQSMKLLGKQFVLGQTIEEGLKNALELEDQGYTFSYDMLGEAACTDNDALRYHAAYSKAITAIAKQAKGDIRSSPGISVKLSALHPRYEYSHRHEVMQSLVPRVLELARQAAGANIGLNIDAEEQDRLDLSLDIIDVLLANAELAGWDGLGVVVQAYGKRALPVIEALYTMAERHDKKIMIRLVKGAYWDSEVKLAQELGVNTFPVYTRKINTDVSYMACAQQLMDKRDRLYPQFATHNAHTGESLHTIVRNTHGARCRVYAPVGAHRDLLAYLVRRLLENGANSSFVNQIVDETIPSKDITVDPVQKVQSLGKAIANPAIRLPGELFSPKRNNSKGYRLNEPASIQPLLDSREAWTNHQWSARPMIAGHDHSEAQPRKVYSPAEPDRVVGVVHESTASEVAYALDAAQAGFKPWSSTPVAQRATILRTAAGLYEQNTAELTSLTTREAGKTILDGIAEVREAVDFLRYYANEAERLDEEEPGAPLGVFVCISPWNFPLAIFTRIAGVCFTGSTEVARIIHRAVADNAGPDTVLIAETGGLNAMIVDSTALPEQAVRDILMSTFQSAGQRCSALRLLYVQEDTYERLLEMLYGAMDALIIGDPWDSATDVSAVIDRQARVDINRYIEQHGNAGTLMKRLNVPQPGNYVSPAVIRVNGIADMDREIFGPVLHVATFKASDIDAIVDDINSRGYGLTFGLHTRIDDRVQQIVERLKVGNAYVNRNQIGAIVGSQPFGGEGLSGTGPKAGGPLYVARFRRAADANTASVLKEKTLTKNLTDKSATHFGLVGCTALGSTPGSSRSIAQMHARQGYWHCQKSSHGNCGI